MTGPESDHSGGVSSGQRAGRPSTVIRTTGRIVAPFVFVYGLFLTLHGTSLPGGGFQGGIVVGAGFVLVALAFGFDEFTDWLDIRVLVGAFLFGMTVFGVVAIGAVWLDAAVFDVFAFPGPVLLTVELVELAIGVMVAAVIVGLVVWTTSPLGPSLQEEKP